MRIFYPFSHRAIQVLTLSLAALFLCLASVQAADLHAIIVCDTVADNIGPSVQADLKKVHNEMLKVSKHTDLTLKEKRFLDHDVNAEIIQYLSSQNFGADDVVLFFFSGHGYRTDTKQNNVWPNLYLTPANKGVDFYLLTKILKEKKPRLLIAIADCCNNIIPEQFAPETIKKTGLRLALTNNLVTHNYRELFLNQRGAIVMSSSKPGEYSWGTRSGGLFTLALFGSLEKEVGGHKPPDWRILLDDAVLKVMKRDLGQTPQYEMDVQPEI